MPIAKTLLTTRFGISNKDVSDPYSKATCRKSIHSTFLEMVDSSFLDQAINRQGYGISKKGLVYSILGLKISCTMNMAL